MQLHSPLRRWRHHARSSQEETGFLRIESPSVATAKDYYNRQCAHIVRDEYGDLGDGSQRAPKVRAIAVAGHPRRHSSPAQHAPTARPVVGYGGDEMNEVESGEMEGGVLIEGKRKYHDFLASNSFQPIHASQVPFNPIQEHTPLPSTSASPTSCNPPTPLHLPITSSPPPRQAQTKIQNPLHPQSLGYIPFEYTMRKLQDWGMVYLYNTATADVFVRGVPFNIPNGGGVRDRKLSVCRGDSVQNEGGEGMVVDAAEETWRGRTLRDRKSEDREVARISVSLERTKLEDVRDQMDTLNDEEIGDSIAVRTSAVVLTSPPSPIPKGPTDESTRNKFFSPSLKPPTQPTSIGGAIRNVRVRIRIIPSCSSSLQITHTNLPRHPITVEKAFPIPISLLHPHAAQHVDKQSAYPSPSYNALTGAPALPLHIDYATYRVPLLGAILLSGFAQRGDTVEVPVPWPEVWEETVVGIYLWGGLVAEKVKHNLEFLGCRDFRA
ncbi:hypothetical protein L211DRAFT_570836 [Terfezia boudieri ATCC MYA-4762]|uniref:Uncharacterized protein n=1 Tax=Terfezia boudieri ATCC MYA-4762 TaxID=1051890 RepID=A0A3N4LB94_9PEZI|nr:hypothetical protein L211DRAFT_570836 [Terfezia boudieri ATCC MYA-4762]